MKAAICLLIFAMAEGFCPARAQSTADWIQILLMDYSKLQELRGIVTDMKDGYHQIRQGFEAVKSIAASNFNVHQLFLDALLAVSPPVQQYYKIGEVLSAEYTLIQAYRRASGLWHGSGRLTAAELGEIDARYAGLLARSSLLIQELSLVLEAGDLRMSDADRLAAIDRVHSDILGELQWLHQYNDRIGVQVYQRASEAGNLQFLKQLYGIVNP